MECRHGNFWIGLGIGSILGFPVRRVVLSSNDTSLIL